MVIDEGQGAKLVQHHPFGVFVRIFHADQRTLDTIKHTIASPLFHGSHTHNTIPGLERWWQAGKKHPFNASVRIQFGVEFANPVWAGPTVSGLTPNEVA